MKPRTPVVLTILVSVFALGLSGAHAQTALYVDDDAPPGGDGTSWSSPFKYLQDALAAASADPTVSEIRVAGGVYKPDQDEAGNVTPGDREATFQLLNGVAIRGGYAGYGAVQPDDRDVTAFSTILSGDLSGNDGPDSANYDENSYHVLTSSGTNETAVLDGVLISRGNADGNAPHDSGGGMINVGGSPTLNNCVFSENSAFWLGAGMHNENSSPTLTGCTFAENRAIGSPSWGGGGMSNVSSSPTLVNCTFSNNHTDGVGGALFATDGSNATITDCRLIGNTHGALVIRVSDATLTRCTFTGNRGGFSAGADVFQSDATFTDCVFSGNDNGLGGVAGIVFAFSEGALINCTFSDNVGSGLLIADSYPKITNCMFLRNHAGGGAGVVIVDITDGTTQPVFVNCVFSGNVAEEAGGAVFLTTPRGRAAFVNCTFTGNVAPWGGGGMWVCGGTQWCHAEVSNCILRDNASQDVDQETAQFYLHLPNASLDVNYTSVQGWTGALGGVGNTGADPLFIDADGEDNIVGTEDDNLRLSSDSPCIDAGDNLAVPDDAPDLDDDGDTAEPTPLDLDRLPRFVNDPNTPDSGVSIPGIPEVVDMGPYEYQDCNDNGENDALDIAEATSDDCNENMVPDECEEDSDGDGVIDACDQCPGQDDRIDEDQNGTPDCLEPEVIPAVSLWGAVVLGLLLLAGGKIGFGRRRIERPSAPRGV